MDQSQFITLLERYEAGKASADEMALLESWYLYEGNKAAETDSKIDYEVTQQRIWTQLSAQPVFASAKKTYPLWIKACVAAAIAMFITGIWFYTKGPGISHLSQIVTQNDIAPGKQGATLILANGKKIKLHWAMEGKIAEEAGISIKKTADGQLAYETLPANTQGQNDTSGQTYNTLSTAKGETYQVSLPDGSKVWLNAASTLSYSPRLMKNGVRNIKLNGEAYFEVARLMRKEPGSKGKERRMPFIVESPGQTVEVLGTHFNVNAYADEKEVTTTLMEGSVRVTPSGAPSNLKPEPDQLSFSKTLLPNQQSLVSKNQPIVVKQVDPELAIAWKNGNFIFQDEKIETVMRSLLRWYNIEVIYQGAIPTDRFSGNISRYKNINQVLMALESTKLVHFKIEGRRVIVTK